MRLPRIDAFVNKFEPSTLRTAFRSIAIIEAITWALLLAAMYAKYVTESEPFGIREGGVPVAGMLHGIAFIVFVAVSIAAWRRFGWTTKVLVLAFVSAVVPLTTIVFEERADRRGLLGQTGPVNSA